MVGNNTQENQVMKHWKVLAGITAVFAIAAFGFASCAHNSGTRYTPGPAHHQEPGSAPKHEPGSASKEEPGSAPKHEPGSGSR